MVLNDKQTEAVNSTEKIIRVVAGAGSGKTRVLTERIKRLLNEGVKPEKILAITFTNKAANEMKERVGNPNVNISTIHSLCVKILRVEYPFPKFRILDADEQLDVIKEIEEEQGIDEKTFKPKEVVDYVTSTKVKRLDPNFNPPTTAPWNIFYNNYVEKLSRMNAMDFDDLVINTAEIFRKEEPKERWSKKFEYILVDEFQDVDNLQYEVIKDLSSVHGNLFVVGDGDQMIYSWRGSSETIFNDFDKDFTECQTIILNRNYRSTSNILDKANKLIKNNEERIDKDLYTEANEGEKVRVKEFVNEEEEAEFIVDEIVSDRGRFKYSDNAILYRSNYLSRQIERKLIRSHVPYTIYGGFRFYDRKEVKDMVAYLKFLQYEDDLTLKRIINVPSRKIGKTKVKAICDKALEKRKTMWETLKDGDYKSKETDEFIKLIDYLRELPFERVIPTICDTTDYLKTLDDDDKVENVNTLKMELYEFVENNPDAKLEDYLADVTLYADLARTKDSDSVQLMTIHTSKGLEFSRVYVIGMSEGKFPKNNGQFDEEERRLAYVAITRAKEELTLCSEKISYAGHVAPSVFIDEVGGFTEERPSYTQSNFRNPYWL